MSFFGGDQKQGSANAWGGFFKQAISSVETRFDSLLDQDATGSSNKNNAGAQDEGNLKCSGLRHFVCNLC